MKLEADRQVLPVPLGQASLPRHRLPGDLARGFIPLQAVVGDLTGLRPIDRLEVVALMFLIQVQSAPPGDLVEGPVQEHHVQAREVWILPPELTGLALTCPWIDAPAERSCRRAQIAE